MIDGLSAEVYALLASLCFAASQVAVRRGMVRTSVVASVLVTLVAAFGVLLVFVLLQPPSEIDMWGAALFAAGGLASPGVARWASNTGTHQLGPSISGSITQGARPLLAVAGGILLLNESLSGTEALGLVLIVAGGWRLTRAREADPSPGTVGAMGAPTRDASGRLLRRGLIFPLVAGLAYAIQDVVSKDALSYLPDARFGAFVGISTALAGWALVTLALPAVRRQVRFGDDLGWLVASGVLAGLAIVNLFAALGEGDITVVSPIVATQPLAVFILSRLLLRHLESLTLTTVLAGTGIVVGTIAVSL